MKLIKIQKVKNALNMGFILGLFSVISLVFILNFDAVSSLLILVPLVTFAIAARVVISFLELKIQNSTYRELQEKEKGSAKDTGKLIHPKSLYC
ncbi:MAG: hypothetical protein ACFFCS_15305 [Candidatus Hodarchaeota archaeon]